MKQILKALHLKIWSSFSYGMNQTPQTAPESTLLNVLGASDVYTQKCYNWRVVHLSTFTSQGSLRGLPIRDCSPLSQATVLSLDRHLTLQQSSISGQKINQTCNR